jgi:hypothetical protein
VQYNSELLRPKTNSSPKKKIPFHNAAKSRDEIKRSGAIRDDQGVMAVMGHHDSACHAVMAGC